MKNKKRFVSFAVMVGLLVALIVTMFLVPIVNVKTYDMYTGDFIPEASGTLNLWAYTKAMMYMMATCFEADGPVWLSVLGVVLNWLVLIGAVVLLGFVIFELCTPNKENWTLKKNATAKKLALVVGYLTVSTFIYEMVAFGVTTALGQGYFNYAVNLQAYFTLALAVGVLVCAYLSGKKVAQEQKPNKARDGVGFAFAAVLSGIFFGLVFAPQMYDGLSFWQLAGTAGEFATWGYPIAAEIFVGISQWVTLAMAIPVGFVLVYSVIGFVRCMIGKSTDWLSGAVKRWSMALLVYSFVYLFMMMAAITCYPYYLCFWFDGQWLITFLPFVMTLLPYGAYIMSTTISHNKKPKE